MLSDFGWLKQVKIKNSSGDVINPATIEKLDELKTALSSIYDAIDDLELTTEHISIDAGQINLNTDELETKLQSVLDQLDVALSTRASEATLTEIKESLGQESGTTILSKLQDLYSRFDVAHSTRASELTLSNVKTVLDAIKIAIEGVNTSIDVALSTRASEATLLNVKSNLDDVKTKLDTLNAKDFATQTTLAQIKLAIDSINTDIDVVLSTRASESTLSEILETLGQESGVTVLSRLQDLLAQFDVDLSTRASEATLIEVRDYLDTVETKLQSLINKNQAQETGGNLDSIKSNTDQLDVDLSTRVSESNFNNKIGEVQASPTQYTLLGRLKDLWDKLVELFNDGVAKIKIWNGTNIAEVTSDGKLNVMTQGRGIIDSNNSINTPLLANDYFVGEWCNILDYAHIVVQIISDQDSIENGLIIEWSSDGVNSIKSDTFSIYANEGKVFSFGCQAAYYRIKYYNGTTTQTVFHLTSVIKTFSQKPSSHRILDELSSEDDAELVRAILAGKSDGTFVNVKVDSAGRLQVVMPTAAALANTPIQISIDKTLSAINSGEWQEVIEYEVPSGYDFNAIGFNALSGVANEAAKAIFKASFGSFVGATDTFTDGEAWILPRFAAKLFVYVTTAIGSGVNDTITVTYTNQSGITGRTGTVTITKSSSVGTRLEVNLQAGDYGIIDVTNVTHSATGQVGDFNLEGNLVLFNLTLTSSNTQYESYKPPLNAIVVPAGGKIYLQYLAASAVANRRSIVLQGLLAPR